MINVLQKHKCAGCYACVSTCDHGCISMVMDQEGFFYPEVDKQKCISCGLCEIVCPILNPSKSREVHSTTAYAAYSKNEEVRLKSSSGGVFSLLAEYVICNGGLVFGVGLSEQFEAIHFYVETFDELEKLRGSKYVQSRIDDTFQQAKAFLEKGRLVLFSGTPCQIGGLLSFLNKEYDNLITQDIICHGVPSPIVWRKYIAFREKRADSPVERIAFRRKDVGWKRYSVSFNFKNDKEYRKVFDKDPMMIAFLKNICLRPSCYRCSYKMVHRQSDITLADFWGVQEVIPEMDDDKGTSLVFLHSPKACRLFQELERKMSFAEVDIDIAIRYNSAMISSVPENIKREAFLADVTNDNFEKVVNKYCRDSFAIKVRRKASNIQSMVKHTISNFRR